MDIERLIAFYGCGTIRDIDRAIHLCIYLFSTRREFFGNFYHT